MLVINLSNDINTQSVNFSKSPQTPCFLTLCKNNLNKVNNPKVQMHSSVNCRNRMVDQNAVRWLATALSCLRGGLNIRAPCVSCQERRCRVGCCEEINSTILQTITLSSLKLGLNMKSMSMLLTLDNGLLLPLLAFMDI